MTVNQLQRNSAGLSHTNAWFVMTQLETAAFAKSTAKKEDQYCFAAPHAQFNTSTPPALLQIAVKRNCVPMRRAPICSSERTNRGHEYPPT
jgi:hypothetical protein